MMERNENNRTIAQIWLEGFRQTAAQQAQAEECGLRF
ncbi:hypothetical protein GA0111570_11037 [Raineyella antarctica]|uniref:Uncharacterized protein n=1 Tax=Raineyella antarctica TaxID=1577474 RepID=A0A1G6HH82_9ACTN|nr:hypothetical protein GA0111570_11037 [Raineyella antarctica]